MSKFKINLEEQPVEVNPTRDQVIESTFDSKYEVAAYEAGDCPGDDMPKTASHVSGGKDWTHYMKRIISSEIGELRSATKGERNAMLNEAAFELFGRSHQLSLEGMEQYLRNELQAAGKHIGLDAKEIGTTINSAFKARHEYNKPFPEEKLMNKVIPINSGITIDNESGERIYTKINWIDTMKRKNIEGKVVEKPMGTMENLEILMNHYGVSVTYDELLLKTNIKGINSLTGNEGNTLIAFMKNKCVKSGLSKCVVDEQLDTISEKYVINPVTDWLKGAKRTTDNSPVDALVSLLPVDNKEWVRVALRRWLIQCCAAADMGNSTPNPEAIAKYESVLVFSGDQGTKKSSFIKYLLPKSLHAYTKEGILLDVKDKDSMLTVLRGWIPELGELDSTFKRSDISALKAFLSNTVDEIRLPYARKPLIIPRHVSCFGTVNDEQYLRDLTGNRRYLPVKVIGSLDVIVKDNFDIENLWAFVWSEYKRGEQWWLTSEEEVIQKGALLHHEDKTIEELLLDIFNFDTPKARKMTGAEVLIAISQPNSRSSVIKLGNALKSLGIEKKRRDFLMPRLRSMDDSFVDF